MQNRKSFRGAQGVGSIRQRSDGRWEGRYTTGRNPGTGQQIQRSVYGSTQTEVVEKLRQLQLDEARGTLLEPLKLTVFQWFDIWGKEYLGGVKSGTVYSYQAHIRNNITPFIGALKLQKLNPHNVQALYNKLQREKNLSPKTIKNLHGVVHRALKQAVDLGYIRRNPADNITLPRRDKPNIQTLPEESLSAFLGAINGHTYEELLFITLFTGVRMGEACGLTWSFVDFEKGTLLIKQQLHWDRLQKVHLLAPTKNDKVRLISPANAVMEKLKSIRQQQLEQRFMAGSTWQNPEGFIFTSAMGTHVRPDHVYRCFKDIVSALGFPHLRFHDLRHTYAVNALRSGDDIKTVQYTLGHHTAAFTLDVYGHVSERMKQDSADRMQRVIDGAMQGTS